MLKEKKQMIKNHFFFLFCKAVEKKNYNFVYKFGIIAGI